MPFSSPPSPEWRLSKTPIDYPDAVTAMEERVREILEGDKNELLWLLEHPALYTAGTSAKSDDLKEKNRFPVHESGRGGQYTYHGPGQRVVYVLLDLRLRGKDLRRHVWNLEEWMIQALAQLGVHAERRQGRVGLWVETAQGEKKIGAVGVRIRKWIAYHGFSLNVDPNLDHFEGIVPCGLTDFGVTSLRALGYATSFEELDSVLYKTRACVEG